jgi:ABC-type enterochelin transport system permease subunit
MPVSTAILGAIFFCGFAVRTPLTSKLYKELGYSAFLGASLSYAYVH